MQKMFVGKQKFIVLKSGEGFGNSLKENILNFDVVLEWWSGKALKIKNRS
jgi:hypothetical protein